MKKDRTLTIVVKNGRYDAYGAPTYLSAIKMNVLKIIGGINETVSDGEYTFDLKWKPFRFYAVLYPKK